MNIHDSEASPSRRTVVEHVEERLAAPRAPGIEGRIAGRALRPGMERELALSVLSQLGASAGAHPLGGGLNGNGLLQMGLGGGDLLTGSAFAMNRKTRHGGILSFWSRGARSSFAGREGALSLGGDVRTTMVGADYAKGPLVAGLSLSHSQGLGEYVGVAGGQVTSSVTGLYPWLGYKATDRVTVWGVAGYGRRRTVTDARTAVRPWRAACRCTRGWATRRPRRR